jgi:hypothetical protein
MDDRILNGLQTNKCSNCVSSGYIITCICEKKLCKNCYIYHEGRYICSSCKKIQCGNTFNNIRKVCNACNRK